MPNPFLNIRPAADSNKKSVQWYQAQVRKLTGLTPEKLVTGSKLTTQILPGYMYMFFYDAKLKDKLPYWDAFPLVLPFKKVPGGFYGINLHYLPYLMRFKLLGALQELATDEKVSEKTRLMLNWSILEKMSSFAPIKHCVKHYLNEHVQSRFLMINYPDWVAASMLPVERFEGARKQQVWQKTKDKF